MKLVLKGECNRRGIESEYLVDFIFMIIILVLKWECNWRGIESEYLVDSIGLYGNKIGVEAGKAIGEALKVNTSLTLLV